VTTLEEQVKMIALPALADEMTGLADDYVAGFKAQFDAANATAKPAILAHLKKAAEYKIKAVQEADAETRRAYVEGVADELASAKTIALSEGVAQTEEAAASFAAGFEAVLSAVGKAAKGLISTVGSAIVSGAISGLTGGDGFDPSGIFPGL
jgi:hypothetical protein